MNTPRQNGRLGVYRQFSQHRTASHPQMLGRSCPDLNGGGYSLDDVDGLGLMLRMFVPTILIGLGTFGSRTVHRIVLHLNTELGRLPAACNYLNVDGAAPESDMDANHHKTIDLGGCGTNPNLGREQFRVHYDELRYILDKQVQDLSEIDPQVAVAHTPREATAFCVIGGSGGSSGGMLHEMISLVHDVARAPRPNAACAPCSPGRRSAHAGQQPRPSARAKARGTGYLCQ